MTEFDPLNIGELIALRIILAMPEGPAITDEWTWKEVMNAEAPQWIHEGPPVWLLEPEMSWKDPRLPVTVRGHVPKGMERAAQELLLGGRGIFPRKEEDSDGRDR